MPTAPMAGINYGATGASPMVDQPSQANLLMAAAELHQRGAFDNPSPDLKTKLKRPSRSKLKVIK